MQVINDTNDKRVKAAWQNSLGHQIPGGIAASYDEERQGLSDLLNEIFKDNN